MCSRLQLGRKAYMQLLSEQCFLLVTLAAPHCSYADSTEVKQRHFYSYHLQHQMQLMVACSALHATCRRMTLAVK